MKVFILLLVIIAPSICLSAPKQCGNLHKTSDGNYLLGGKVVGHSIWGGEHLVALTKEIDAKLAMVSDNNQICVEGNSISSSHLLETIFVLDVSQGQ